MFVFQKFDPCCIEHVSLKFVFSGKCFDVLVYLLYLCKYILYKMGYIIKLKSVFKTNETNFFTQLPTLENILEQKMINMYLFFHSKT